MLCSTTSVWANDTLELKFAKSSGNNPTNIFTDVYKLKGNVNHYDSTLRLFDGTLTNKYVVTNLILQLQPKFKIENKLPVLLGCDTELNLFVVVDKNCNKDFGDDSVYKVAMNNLIEDVYSWYSKVPIIRLDSLRVIDSLGSVSVIHEELKMAPIPGNERNAFFREKKEIKNTDAFSLAVYSTNIYSTTFILDNINYKAFVRINPLYVNYLSKSKPDFNKEALIQIYKKTNENWNLIDYKNVSLLEENNYPEKYLQLDSSFLILNKVQWDSLKFQFNVTKTIPVDSNDLAVRSDKITGYKNFSFRSQSEDYLISRSEEYTIVEFSGSWCIPCKKILPSYKKLFSIYKNKVAFRTVAVEQSYEDAKSYFTESKIPWDFFYENMKNCDQKFCFKEYLNIRLFPTFVLFDKNGSEIFRGESIDALEVLRTKLKTLLY